MKKNLATILLLIFWLSTLAQQTPDEKKVIKVIKNESDAAVKLDYDKWSNTWLQNETITLATPNGRIYNGFKEISEWAGIKNIRKPFASKMEQTNFQVRVNDKSAWATYDETVYDTNGEVLVKLLITKILENTNDEWKIVHTSLLDKSHDEVANKAVINQWIEARNTNDLEAALKFWPDDTHEGLSKAFNNITEAFPDVQIIVDDMFVANNKVALRWTFKATHQGAYQKIPATGKEVIWKGIDIYTIADGKIVSLDRSADWSVLMVQLSDEFRPQAMPYYQQFSRDNKN